MCFDHGKLIFAAWKRCYSFPRHIILGILNVYNKFPTIAAMYYIFIIYNTNQTVPSTRKQRKRMNWMKQQKKIQSIPRFSNLHA